MNHRVLVTRAKKQASDLAERIAALGFEPVILPSIEIVPPTDLRPLLTAIEEIASYDWVLFTSVNGVRAFGEALNAPSRLEKVQLGAVGIATAAEVERQFRKPDFMPVDFRAANLVPPHIAGERILLPRGDLARFDVVQVLQDSGAEVVQVEAYRTVVADWPTEFPEPDILTFTSSSGVLATHERLAERGLLTWLETKPIVVIGPVTARTVQDLGYRVAAEATEHTIPGLVDALTQLCLNA